MSANDPIRGVAGIVLAGGGTRSRFAPRCLHVDGGEPRVRGAARAALEAGLWPVVAVVGDHADEVRAALAGLPLATVADAAFERGPGSAIQLGIRRVTECAPGARGVVLLGCEPPAVDAGQLRTLPAAAGARPGAPAAIRRGDRLGLPAFFPAQAFAELAALGPEDGCAELLARHAAEVVAVAADADER